MKNCLIFGEALVDDFPDQSVIGGAPFNVARSLALLGVENLMITRIADDAHGRQILRECERCGVATEGVQIDPHYPTGRVVVHMGSGNGDADDGHTHRFEIMQQQAYDFIDGDQVMTVVAQQFPEYPPDLVYFGSLIQRQEGSRASLLALLESELCEGSTKFLDLNLREAQFTLETVQLSLSYADIVKLNEDELVYVLTHALPEAYQESIELEPGSLTKACRAVMAEYMMQAMIVTLGEAGYFYLDASCSVFTNLGHAGSSLQMPANWTLCDTVGAGDAFSACFIRGWLANRELDQVLSQAYQFATAICGVRGAIVPDRQFYQAWP